MRENKKNLGCGVEIDFDNNGIILTQEGNSIYLDVETVQNLVKYFDCMAINDKGD